MNKNEKWWLIAGLILMGLGLISSLFLEGDRPSPWFERDRRDVERREPKETQDASPWGQKSSPGEEGRSKEGVAYFQ